MWKFVSVAGLRRRSIDPKKNSDKGPGKSSDCVLSNPRSQRYQRSKNGTE
jgi:hypothetical protein